MQVARWIQTGIRKRTRQGAEPGTGDRWATATPDWEASIFESARAARSGDLRDEGGGDRQAPRSAAREVGRGNLPGSRHPRGRRLREAAKERLAKAQARAVLTKRHRPYMPLSIRATGRFGNTGRHHVRGPGGVGDHLRYCGDVVAAAAGVGVPTRAAGNPDQLVAAAAFQ